MDTTLVLVAFNGEAAVTDGIRGTRVPRAFASVPLLGH